MREKSSDFVHRTNVTSEIREIRGTLSCDEWAMDDTTLICRSSKSDTIFYRLSVPSLSVISSFGIKGDGPDEFVSPHIAANSTYSISIIDTGKRKIFTLNGDSVSAEKSLPSGISMNRTKMLYDGSILYLSTGDSGPFIGAIYPDSSRVPELLNLSNIDSDISNITYDVADDHMIIGSSAKNTIGIYNISTGDYFLLSGPDNADFYYSDVVCGPDSFFLLSQSEVNGQTMAGTSKIEQYDYEGNPIAEYTLDFIASSMIYDSGNKLFIMTSPMDDDFRIVRLNDSPSSHPSQMPGRIKE